MAKLALCSVERVTSKNKTTNWSYAEANEMLQKKTGGQGQCSNEHNRRGLNTQGNKTQVIHISHHKRREKREQTGSKSDKPFKTKE